jgi:hypothetical protein
MRDDGIAQRVSAGEVPCGPRTDKVVLGLRQNVTRPAPATQLEGDLAIVQAGRTYKDEN